MKLTKVAWNFVNNQLLTERSGTDNESVRKKNQQNTKQFMCSQWTAPKTITKKSLCSRSVLCTRNGAVASSSSALKSKVKTEGLDDSVSVSSKCDKKQVSCEVQDYMKETSLHSSPCYWRSIVRQPTHQVAQLLLIFLAQWHFSINSKWYKAQRFYVVQCNEKMAAVMSLMFQIPLKKRRYIVRQVIVAAQIAQLKIVRISQ